MAAEPGRVGPATFSGDSPGDSRARGIETSGEDDGTLAGGHLRGALILAGARIRVGPFRCLRSSLTT